MLPPLAFVTIFFYDELMKGENPFDTASCFKSNFYVSIQKISLNKNEDNKY